MPSSSDNKLRVLITGVTGFVGRSLCTELLKQGYFIRGVTRRSSSPTSENQDIDYLVVDDIGPDTDWTGCLADIDVVIHLAARVHQLNDQNENPLKAYRRTNTLGTAHLASCAASAGVKRFIFLSSIKVNGECTTAETGFVETDPVKPDDPYGISKYEAEQILHKLQIEKDMQVVIIRPPLIFGPGVKANFLKLFSLVDRGVPLPLGCVDNQRSFIFIGNLVDILINCIVQPKAAGNTYLVSDATLSTSDLIREIATALGKKVCLVPVPMFLLKYMLTMTGKRAVFNRLTGSLRINSEKLQNQLNWSPMYTLQEGLRDTAKWFISTRSRNNNNSS